VDRWIKEAVESVANQLTDPETAMRRLADEINQRIRRNLERSPHLQRTYEEVTGRPYTEDWWRTYQHQ
jgi:hypothetical protein